MISVQGQLQQKYKTLFEKLKESKELECGSSNRVLA
jgi:hypothetical protein